LAKSYCYITKKNGGVIIDCSYDPDFLEVLKANIPASEQRYDPSTKYWWVSERFSKQAIRDCNHFFENVIEC